MWYFILFLILTYFGLRIYQNRISQSYKLQIFFCPPGGGKTTLAAWYAKHALKRNENVWSNVNIKGCQKVEKNDLGNYLIENGTVILDEAGVEFDNRKFKEFTSNQTFFFKYHRHYKVHVLVFSQSYDDMDLKIRNLAANLFIVGRSLLPFFIYRREIGKSIGINEDKQIVDTYKFIPFSRKYIFSPVLWKMFNTYARPELPTKEWETWA